MVVGETGAGDASVPKLAVGETPNLAARLQGIAKPDEIIVAEITRRLAGGAVEAEDIGAHSLKGIVEAERAWRVNGLSQTEGRFVAAHGTHLSPLVGRDSELALLMDKWQRAKTGDGQLVLLCGEPGIGKSRLIQELRDAVQADAGYSFLYQCSPFHTDTAFHPISETFAREARFRPDEPAESKLDKLDARLAAIGLKVDEASPLIASALSIPTGERYPPLEMSPQLQKQRTIEALVEAMVGAARQVPLLFLGEDMHWCDPSSLETASRIIEQIGELRLLAVYAYRPEFVPPWPAADNVTTVALSRLGDPTVGELVDGLTGGKPLPEELAAEIISKTDGVPLFVEELTKTVLESDLVEDTGDAWQLAGPFSGLSIPATLHDSLMARLDRLTQVKEVAQIGACIGRDFSHELLAAVSPMSEERLCDALQKLIDSGLIFESVEAATRIYSFKHAMVRDTAYGSLLRTTRTRVHARVAVVMTTDKPELGERDPDNLARHHILAGDNAAAGACLLRAARRNIRRSAYIEALAQLEKALIPLRDLPQSEERDRMEAEVLEDMTGAKVLLGELA